jgi:predicted dehydrogenase
MNRKDFIKHSSLGVMGMITHPYIVKKQTSKYNAVLIGSGWWGTNILREGIRTGELKITALCDVDEAQLKKCKDEVDKLCSDNPKLYKDFRECIEKEKPEIVINATPDHWHALIAIYALNHGAHVFLEKPISHTVLEGAAILKAARNNKRVCIVDFHRRYSPHNVSGIDFLRSGKAGKIKEVKAFVQYNWGPGKLEEQPTVPQGLDWDMYCGPAALTTYNPAIHPRGWRHYRNFANGQIGDWGPHWFDQILWWSEEKAPKSIFSSWTAGGRDSRSDTPTTQTAVYTFESFVVTWDHTVFNSHKEKKSENVGVYFHGTEGTFHMGWIQGWTFYPNNQNKEVIHEDAKLDQPDGQNIKMVWQDFLQCIKTNKLPHADIAAGRNATNMALLGMVSAQLGRSIQWDDNTNKIKEDKEANALLSRKYRGNWKYPV